MTKTNIALIGMPGAGKSTVGKLLANRLSMKFCDTDQLIESTQQDSLQNILDAQGFEQLRAIEERTILDYQFDNTIIATGGSAIYGAQGIAYLQSCAVIFYLEASIDTLAERISNWSERGIACPESQTVEDLFAERVPLYRQYADHMIETDSTNENQIAERIIHLWGCI
jgi:shikimate kinase